MPQPHPIYVDSKTEARYGFGLHKDQVDAGHRTTAFKVSCRALSYASVIRNEHANKRSGFLLPRFCTRSRLASPSYRYVRCTFVSSRLRSSGSPSLASWESLSSTHSLLSFSLYSRVNPSRKHGTRASMAHAWTQGRSGIVSGEHEPSAHIAESG